MPQEKIIIKFEPEGHPQLIQAINALAKAQVGLVGSQAKVAKANKDTVKAQKELAIANRISKQTSDDLERQRRKEEIATIKNKDAIRANKLEIKKEEAARKQVLSSLKADIINRNKVRVAAEKSADAHTKFTGKIKQQNVANKKLAQSQHLVEQRMSSNTKTANILQGAFATLRNKLLLLSFAMTMAVKPLLNLIKAQSDAEEIANKFNVVFGKQADVVRDWAGTFGQSVGRASSELQGMLATLQDTFVPLGFARKEATKLSISLTKLALDVASFNNKLDADVIRDFQSALVGNHETVRKYGIVITEAQLAAEALRSGIIETKRELTSQEKVQARLNLIIAGSKDAIGDLERTQDSYANTLKRFNAEVRVTQEELGKALIPLATELLAVMTKLVIHFRDTDTIKNYALFLGGVAISMSGVTAATFSLAGSLAFLRTALIRTGFGALAVGLGYLAEQFLFADDAAEEFNDEIDANAIKAKQAEDKIADLAQEFDSYEAGLRKSNETLEDHKKNLSSWVSIMSAMHSALNTSAELSQRLAAASTESAAHMSGETEANKDYVAMQKLGAKQANEMRIAKQNLTIATKQSETAEGSARFELAATIAELENQILTYKKLHPIEVDNLLNKQRLTKEAKEKAEADKKAAKALKEVTDAEEKTKQTTLAGIQGLKDRKNELDFFYKVMKDGNATLSFAEQLELRVMEARAKGIKVDEQQTTTVGQKLTAGHEYYDLLFTLIGLENEYAESLNRQSVIDSALAGTIIGKTEALTAERDILVEAQSQTEQGSAKWLQYAEAIKNVKQAMEDLKPEAETMFSEEQFEAMNQFQQGWDMIANTAGMYFDSVTQGLAQEMQELKNSDAFKAKSKRGQEAAITALEDKQRSEKEKTWKMTKAMNLAQIAMDTAAAVMNIWKGVPKVDFGASTVALTAIAIATGAMQAGIVASQSMPKFQQGGMIGGRRHSQGGTMIEAEQGEFIMSRNAVKSIGIENLNRMNEGGGGDTVTVNVSGNVMSQDFVEGELAEQIKEAVRRGTDFGVS